MALGGQFGRPSGAQVALGGQFEAQDAPRDAQDAPSRAPKTSKSCLRRSQRRPRRSKRCPRRSKRRPRGSKLGSKDVQEASESHKTAVQVQFDSKQRHLAKTVVFLQENHGFRRSGAVQKASLEGQVEPKWRLEASWEGQVESKRR